MQPEQEANLDFLVRRGMAIRIRKRRVTAQAILEAVDQLLADKNAHKEAHVVQRILESCDGPGNVAQFLRRLARLGSGLEL
jgi:UDP:flavonoid glycosyltransferase YjiC (YdhE family)